MMQDFGFFIGDLVLVRDTYPFFGLEESVGSITSFPTFDTAIVEFDNTFDIVCKETEEVLVASKFFIPVRHLERLVGSDTEMSLLLENQELKERLTYYQEALELSEDLREQLSKSLIDKF